MMKTNKKRLWKKWLPINPPINHSMPTFAHLQSLYDQYWKDCAHKSYHDFGHPAYREIVGYGKDAIPFLLKNINHSWLSANALMEIVGSAVKIPKELRGDIQAISDAWIKWANENGYGRYLVLI